MPIIKIKMLVSRHTTEGAKKKGEAALLPQREAESMIARGQAKLFEAKKPEAETPQNKTKD